MKQRPGKPIGERHYAAKLTVEKVRQIREMRKTKFTPYHILAKEYGVSACAIFRAANYQTWFHIHD